jgi:transposase
MDYVAGHKGRFVTVMPRSRREDQRFRKWIQTNQPAWELVWDRPNPRRSYGPRDRWWVFRDPLPSREAWPVIWVYSSLLALHTEHTRAQRLARASEELAELKQKLANPRSRIRKAGDVDSRVEEILQPARLRRYLKVRRTARFEQRFRQRTRGRPGPNTSYRRIIRRHWDIEWEINEAAIAYDRKSDGMYPLLTNDTSLTPAQVLQAHKRQPTIEKRFEQTKTVFEIAPVFLKNEGRIEALFFLYFLALLVQGLIERELRLAMKREQIAELPLYPEQRLCRKPCTEQILRLFSLAEGQVLRQNESTIQTFDPELTDLQRQILRLLRVPTRAYQLPR